jgi:hypothetical protein
MFGFLRKVTATMREATDVQKDLTFLFKERGMDFMHLNPVIHNVVLRDAMALGNPKLATEKFFTTVEMFGHKGGNDDEKAGALLAYYTELSKRLKG